MKDKIGHFKKPNKDLIFIELSSIEKNYLLNNYYFHYLIIK